LLLREKLLLLRQLRVSRRVRAAAGLACDPRDLPIDLLKVIFEPLQVAGRDRSGDRRCRGQLSLRRCGRWSLGGRARRGLAGGAALVLDSL